MASSRDPVKQPPKHNKPGNWRDGSIIDVDEKKKGTDTFKCEFNYESCPDLQVCKHCKKSILKTAARLHVQACLKAKREKLQRKKKRRKLEIEKRRGLPSKDVEGEDGKGGSDDDDDDEKGPGGFKEEEKQMVREKRVQKQKKKKEEPKPKAPKPKGPVDVERQCGVLKDGVPCASAVPGRTLPYDMLLSQYQKKNQAKQQKAAIDANAPLEDEELL
ncbi:hypothetical protein DID88_009732 [Monilinia fructigena]|uniref:SCA7 domain-containing protein n=1 Tax=Monilinia fructigena TaxID=38457 RepID=A0A395IK22_9HELO|nr:hypothetical protein DID88_009732 [Monilinia fructigena]